MSILTGIGIFVATLFLIEGSYYFVRKWRLSDRRRVRHRLRSLSSSGYETEIPSIERQTLLSEVPWLNRWLGRYAGVWKMNLYLEQSGTSYPLGFYILLTLLLAISGYLAVSLVSGQPLVRLAVALFSGCLPFLYVFMKKTRRMEKFQRQLPEAMELIARALKAGHTFNSGLKMVGNEMEDPIGFEFDRTLSEINLGVDTAEALRNLSRRVDCADLRFFVVSVVIQRETGGNLAEILDNIAYLIRERFKLQGRIRVLSAEGKLSAIILIALPFLIAMAIYGLNPGYLQVLATDPLGKKIVLLALVLMGVGVLAMRRMIQIKV